MTRSLNQYHLFERTTLPADPLAPPDAEEMAKRETLLAPEIQHRVCRKAETVHQTLCEQLRHYFVQQVVSPEDRWWLAFSVPTSSHQGHAIIEKLHEPLKEKLVEETQKLPSYWLSPTLPIALQRIGFVEYVVVQLFDKELPPSVQFFNKYVTLRDELEHHLERIRSTQRPRLVQLFSRFDILYKGRILELPSIYDTLAHWIHIIATDFPQSRLWRLHLLPYIRDERRLQTDTMEELVFL
jgi:hypothetical protein